MSVAVTLYKRQVAEQIERAAQEVCKKVALQAVEYAAVDAPVDTGFYANTIYAVWNDGSTYGETDDSGDYISERTGQNVYREIGPELSLPEDYDAALVAGAVYAIWVELLIKPVLQDAAEQARHDLGSAAESISYREGWK